MSRIILLAPLCLLLVVGPAFGVQGPTPPSGWGIDCTEWTTYSNPWDSGEMCYDPVLGSGGEGWRICGGGQVVWPELHIELWIEMECLIHWDASAVQVHRASDYSDVVLTFCGWSKCNNGQWIITTPPTALGNLDYLPFVEDMFGRVGPTYGTNIPLTWEYNLDGAGYLPMVDGTDGAKQFLVDLCDHSWCIRIIGDIVYHQEDGYYYLGGPGCYICPSEPL